MQIIRKSAKTDLSIKMYLAVALPFMLSTVTQPLLGAVDTAVVGHMRNPANVGGVAIGAVLFNTIYWIFGFLRVSTSGLMAQSLGSKSEADRVFAYLRPISLALVISLVILLLQNHMLKAAMHVYSVDSDVADHVRTYYHIRIWGAPFVLLGYVNLGWLMGSKCVKSSMLLQITANVINSVLDIFFVLVLHWGVAGVSLATLISQIYSFGLGLHLVLKQMNLKQMRAYFDEVFKASAFMDLLRTNGNLMIRTICLLIMTNLFMSKAAILGTVVLAANAILYQIQYIISYMFDGFSNASSIFAGQAVGKADRAMFVQVVSISKKSAWIISSIITLVLIVLKNPFLGLFTSMEDVLEICRTYYIWLEVFPWMIGVGMVLYGVYSGALFTASIRDSMVISLVVFVVSLHIGTLRLGNHGLWLAFILFSLSRSITMARYIGKLLNSKFQMTSLRKEIESA